MNHKMELYLLTRAFEKLAEADDWQAGLHRRVCKPGAATHARVNGEPLRVIYVRQPKRSSGVYGRRSKYDI